VFAGRGEHLDDLVDARVGERQRFGTRPHQSIEIQARGVEAHAPGVVVIRRAFHDVTLDDMRNGRGREHISHLHSPMHRLLVSVASADAWVNPSGAHPFP
jgi:hypothetical protein